MSIRRSDWLGLFLLAFLLRMMAAVALDGLRHPEMFEYDDIARAMVAGRGFSYYHLGVVYQSYTAPLYSWLSAAVYWAGGTIAAVMLLQMLMGAAQAVLVASLAERLFRSAGAGLVAGLLMAVHPGLIIYASTKAHTLILDSLCFTLILWQCWRFADTPTLARAVAAGAVIGLGALSRGTAVVFLPIAGVWLLWARRERWRMVAGRWAAAALCAALVLLPWAVRNTRVNGEFVWMLTTEGEDLWDGNNPAATGHSYVNPNLLVIDTLTPDERRELRAQPSEMAQSRWFRAHALAFIEANPGAFASLTLRKFLYFWWFSPQSGAEYARTWLRAYQVFYVIALVLAALGVRRAGTSDDPDAWPRVVLLAVFLLGLSALQSLYYVEGRHRWAVEPLLLVISGGGAGWIADRWRRIA